MEPTGEKKGGRPVDNGRTGLGTACEEQSSRTKTASMRTLEDHVFGLRRNCLFTEEFPSWNWHVTSGLGESEVRQPISLVIFIHSDRSSERTNWLCSNARLETVRVIFELLTALTMTIKIFWHLCLAVR
jgi:hypothetical protein